MVGEPLLHPALPELLQTADALDFRVNITTNGTLLPQRSKLLAAAPAVRKVSISLHSQEASADRRWEGYLEHCIDFARQAAVGGKIIGLRYFGVLAEMEKSICLRKCSRWWRRTGSNRGPPACEAGALTS